jgi:VIT1/CCC1 family predicted Fe2+/Mn2+ transporter
MGPLRTGPAASLVGGPAVHKSRKHVESRSVEGVYAAVVLIFGVACYVVTSYLPSLDLAITLGLALTSLAVVGFFFMVAHH